MDRSRRPNPAAGVRFVTDPDGCVTAEHVETGDSATGETAVDALEALYAECDELDAPDAGLGAEAAPRESKSEWEWIDPSAIRRDHDGADSERSAADRNAGDGA